MHCSQCNRKSKKGSQSATECTRCEKSFCSSCVNLEEIALDQDWFCSNCLKDDQNSNCDVCHHPVKSAADSIKCSRCSQKAHVSCVNVASEWTCAHCIIIEDGDLNDKVCGKCQQSDSNLLGYKCGDCQLFFHETCIMQDDHKVACVAKFKWPTAHQMPKGSFSPHDHQMLLLQQTLKGFVEQHAIQSRLIEELRRQRVDYESEIKRLIELNQPRFSLGENSENASSTRVHLQLNPPNHVTKSNEVIDAEFLENAMKTLETSRGGSRNFISNVNLPSNSHSNSDGRNESSRRRNYPFSFPAVNDETANNSNRNGSHVNHHPTEHQSYVNEDYEARKLRKNLMKLPSFKGDILQWTSFYRIFEDTTRIGRYQDYENVARLQAALTGEALQRVSPFFPTGNVDIIINTLKDYYGRPSEIIDTHRDRIVNFRKLKGLFDKGIHEFSVLVVNYVEQVKMLGRNEDLLNTSLISDAVKILCETNRLAWLREAKRIETVEGKYRVDMGDFAKFVSQLSREIPTETNREMKDTSERKSSNVKSVNIVQVKKPEAKKSFACLKCGDQSHSFKVCKQFKDLDAKQRMNFVMENKICSRCLSTRNHNFRECNVRCDVAQCNGKHNSLLHDGSKKRNGEGQNVEAEAPRVNTHQLLSVKTNDIMNIVVPIRVYCGDGKRFIDTHAMFDNCADLTLIDEDFWKKLNLEFKSITLTTMWTKDFVRSEESQVGSINVSTVQGGPKYELKNVATSKGLNLKRINFNSNEMKEKFSYLKGLKLSDFKDVQPKILLGLDASKLTIESESICGPSMTDPVACKTLFGWAVRGSTVSKQTGDKATAYYVKRILSHSHVKNEEEQEENDDIHHIVKRGFAVDSLCTVPSTPLVSEEDKRAYKIMNESIKLIDGRFHMRLLWKKDDVVLPDNFNTAVRRMILDEKRLEKLNLVKWKSDLIKDKLAKGYIRKATEADLNTKWERINYCPHFVTINENKIPPKARDVSDVAAPTKGVSLNSFLLKGPDNMIPLARSLMRMRENAIAFTADIREMFHRILIQSPDDQCQRFLFRDGDYNMDPRDAIYIEQAMMFGPRCSPAIAQFVKNYLAEKFKHSHPKSYEVIKNFTYVDDSSDSQPTVDEAFETAMGCIEIYKFGGFDLVAFQSNSKELLRRLPAGHVKESVDLVDKSDDDNIVKILGLRWSTSSDEFLFVLKEDENFKKLMDGDITKRRVLRAIMQIFDPLGFLSLCTIRGKFIIQQMWANGDDWDAMTSEKVQESWKEFAKELTSISNIRIPRQFSKFTPSQSKVQLLVFVDASDIAYAAAAYLRITNDDENFTVSLAMAKAKVAPLKYISVPRLELNAALLGSRVAESIKELVSFNIHEVKYYSDSKTVLSWIKSTEYKFKAFVAARVGEILDCTSVSQWNYIPSKENVADDATKWKNGREFHSNQRWFVGPEFLKEDETTWPIVPIEKIGKVELEEVTSFTFIHRYQQSTELKFLDDYDLRKFSDWYSFVRSVAYLLRLAKLSFKGRKVIFRSERDEAEKLVMRKIQLDAYGDIISDLKYIESLREQGKSEEELNSLYSESLGNLQVFAPFVDKKDGMLRMSSKAQSSKLSYAIRNPIILPNNHPWVEFFVRHYHERNFHVQDNATIGDIRKLSWIPNIKSLLKKVKRKCHKCYLRRLKPSFPQMGNLHMSRFDFGYLPWTHVGIDAFGPFEVTIGRSTVKRYGLIFTCLTYRAVHIEMCESMSANHCMLSIRNFLALRTVSKHFYSDRGTNFIKSAKMMVKDFLDIQQELGEEVAKKKNIDWHFISPYSPWKGGAWEILIKAIKRCLSFTLDNSRIHNERVLETTLKEIACLMNRRPLTNAPTDPNNDQPLTPNTVLIGDDEYDLQLTTGVFDEGDESSTHFYRRAECLVRKFMSIFIRDYLPEISKREKWHDVKDVKIGDLVLWFEKSRNQKFAKPSVKMWKKAKVIKLHPSKTGKVSVVDILVGGDKPKVMRYRAVANLIFLNLNAGSPSDVGIQTSEPEYEGECFESEEDELNDEKN